MSTSSYVRIGILLLVIAARYIAPLVKRWWAGRGSQDLVPGVSGPQDLTASNRGPVDLTPNDSGPISPVGRFEHARAFIVVACALLIALFLYAAYQTPLLAPHHEIRFDPEQYGRIVFNSGKAVSAAMSSVNSAPDEQSRAAAVAAVQRMIDAGDAEAAFRLGRYYHLETSEPNYALALKYYQIALDRHHGWAANNLGLLYRYGLGVARDDDKAYELFQSAAGLNNPWGYWNLAEMNFEGITVSANATKAIAWLEEGARNNCTLCLIREAAVYHSGSYGVQVDRDKAVALLEKAAALGDSEAKLIIAELHIVGDSVPQSSRAAFDSLKTLSDDGDGAASTLLGELSSDDKIRDFLFEDRLGGVDQRPRDLTDVFPQDSATATHYWERGSQQGSCASLVDLSSVLDRGIGRETDHEKAADYVERAARCDPANGFYLWKLAMRFFDANGVARDCQVAERVFTQSLNHGFADSAVNLGYIYDKGCSPIARDDKRALQIYLLGAKLGVALCQNNVGAMLKHGRGVPAPEVARGYAWIKLASLRGDELAKANLQDPRFTPEVRAAGMLQFADLQRRLLTVPSDPQAIQRDPWY
jgi:TPR repeat protein